MMLSESQKSKTLVRLFSVTPMSKYKSVAMDIKDVQKLRMFSEVFGLPSYFFDGLEDYANRNAIANKKLCTSCFKAFLLKTGQECVIPNRTMSFFSSYFACESGHNGYFLDQNAVYII